MHGDSLDNDSPHLLTNDLERNAKTAILVTARSASETNESLVL